MNEVSNIKPLNVVASQRGGGAKVADGKTLPLEATKPVPAVAPSGVLEIVEKTESKVDSQQHLAAAIGTMNDFVQNVKRDLQFTVDQELNQTVIKVVDSSSGKLIRQIPEELFLELARKVKETGELHLLNATG